MAGLVAMLRQGVQQRGLQGSLLESTRGLWTGLAVVALAVGVGVGAWGLTLPAYRGISLLGIPFLAIGLLVLRVARSARRAQGA